ncbi:hypothetical protein [Amycolatopsis sp. CA-230715]|uniref:hypothetical protein n=1 Tax=Amycolatopsis sp. CA-230715 TaxID=2745196 RepID=UPI001C01EA6C|nr:hypothetical protein [Amycolatopsis sp. CA-230715]QWF82344.1 hypothetical protein HUW46_05781 [Amycolatopsis sp. CA-230715]
MRQANTKTARGVIITAIASALLSAPAASAATKPSAAPEVLPPLPGGDSSIAAGANDAGTIVGSSGPGTRATQWKNGIPTPLAVPDGATEASAIDINNNGVIVGEAGPRGARVPIRWNTDGTVTKLQTLPGETSTSARHVNDNGEIAGYSGKYVVRWDASGAITALHAPDGDDDNIVLGDINNSGTVVGFTTRNAVRFTKGAAGTILPGLPGASSTWARAISDTDIIVGTAGDSPEHPVRWNADDQIQVLDEFPGSGSQCFDVANDGTAVGFSGSYSAKWDSDGRVSAFEQLPNDQYGSASATSISKNGAYVTGTAYTQSYTTRGVVWRLK